jgi:hypothetical protein
MKTCEAPRLTLAAAADAPQTAASGWLKLVEYGEYPHRLGLQVVTAEAARRMVRNFNSLVQRLARRFRGVPVYIGHPDDAQYSGLAGHGDTRAYGWVRSLEAREDSFWAYVNWSRAGQELIDNVHFKFLSPRWEMEAAAQGKFLPRLLLSIGLTNHPNLPSESIAELEDGAGAANGRVEPGSGAFSAPSLPVLANECRLSGDWGRAPLSRDLHLRRNPAGKMQGQRLLSLVSERMVSADESFTAAWRSIKNTHPALFDATTFSTAEKSPQSPVNI